MELIKKKIWICNPNPSNRLGLKFGFIKNIIFLHLIGSLIRITGEYFYVVDGKTVNIPTNFDGSVKMQILI